MILDIFFYLIFIYYLKNINLILISITLDNLFSSLIVFFKIKIYKFNVIYRYLYLLTIYVIYFIIHQIFWINYQILLFSLLFIPFIQNFLIKYIFIKYFDNIINEFNNISKILILKILTNLINNILNIETKICFEDIVNINYNFENIFLFFKKILILSVIKYFKYNKLYYNLIKLIYNYQTGEYIESIKLINAKNNIIDIIKNKNWEKLLEINSINSLITIYIELNNNGNNLNILFNKLNYIIFKILSLFTIISFFKLNLLIYLTHLYFDYNNHEKIMFYSYFLYLIIFFDIIQNYNFILYLLIFFESYDIIFNNYSFMIYKILYNKLYLIFNEITKYNKQNILLLSLPIIIKNLPFVYLLLFIINFNKIESVYISILFYIFSSFSNYSYNQMIILIPIFYLSLNLYKKIKHKNILKNIINSYSLQK